MIFSKNLQSFIKLYKTGTKLPRIILLNLSQAIKFAFPLKTRTSFFFFFCCKPLFVLLIFLVRIYKRFQPENIFSVDVCDCHRVVWLLYFVPWRIKQETSECGKFIRLSHKGSNESSRFLTIDSIHSWI